MNKKLISGITILVIVALTLSIWLCTERQTSEPFIPSPSIEPEPYGGPLSTGGYVYDDKLNYGFEYPDGWEMHISLDKDFEQCDPLLLYENYTCGDFPDENIKKQVSFGKSFKKQFEGSDYESEVSVDLEFIVKSATDLQEVTDEFKKGAEMSGLPILNEATISVNNIDGYDILCGDSETPTWKLRKVVFFANGTAYIFTYSSQDEFYRMYEEIFNNTIKSFNIK
ncbi:MAG: hypothetical protein MIO93_06915 [ANME-2 cluster archaeon]|nr:hypothetical protein [ANME-2 cluster archaeon]